MGTIKLLSFHSIWYTHVKKYCAYWLHISVLSCLLTVMIYRALIPFSSQSCLILIVLLRFSVTQAVSGMDTICWSGPEVKSDISWLFQHTLCQHWTSIYFRQESILSQRACSWVDVCISPLMECCVGFDTKEVQRYEWRLYIGINLTTLLDFYLFVFKNNVTHQFVKSNL